MDYLEAINKIERFISYQDRSEFELKNKLRLLKVNTSLQTKVLNELKANGAINDERFAINFVQGKFRIKRWGKIKIRYALKTKYVQEELIAKALNSIEESDYKATLYELYKYKRADYPKSMKYEDKSKLVRYLQAKGYELEYIMPLISSE